MLYRFVSSATFCVAPLAEAVDRNMDSQKDVWGDFVSPSSRRAWIEIERTACRSFSGRSPSSRRAWIEIRCQRKGWECSEVALLAEGVDRNLLWWRKQSSPQQSPSSRRAWIEIGSSL